MKMEDRGWRIAVEVWMVLRRINGSDSDFSRFASLSAGANKYAKDFLNYSFIFEEKYSLVNQIRRSSIFNPQSSIFHLTSSILDSLPVLT